MIIFIYGEDTFRSRQKLKEFKDKFIREINPDGSGIVEISGETTNLGEIRDAANSSSLFSQKRMIVIENIFRNKSKIAQDEIAEYLKKIEKDNENIIIFFDDTSGKKMGRNKLYNLLFKNDSKLKQQKFVQQFPQMSNAEIMNWTRQEFEKRGGSIAQNALFVLAGMVGNDMWLMNNEIDKLIGYAGGKEIQEEDVREMVNGKVDENIFALTDAIGAKNKKLSLELFNKEIDAGAAEAYLLFMIIRQFKIILQVKAAVDQNMSQKDIASYLKIHPFVVQKSMTQARSFSLELLKRILNKLVQIDSETKTGKTDLITALNLLLVKI